MIESEQLPCSIPQNPVLHTSLTDTACPSSSYLHTSPTSCSLFHIILLKVAKSFVCVSCDLIGIFQTEWNGLIGWGKATHLDCLCSGTNPLSADFTSPLQFRQGDQVLFFSAGIADLYLKNTS